MRPRIYITQPVAQSAIARLKEIAEVRFNPDPLHIMTKDELIAAVRENDILFCLLHDHVDRDVIAANPGLKAVASMTITPADIDCAEATKRGIPVTVIPALLLDDPTSDLAWGLLLSVVLMGFAANLLSKLLERQRWIAWVGLLIVLYVAVKMIWDGAFDVAGALAAG